MKRKALLAIDVGGSNTRAYLVDRTGHCLGYGRDRGGNPASNGPEFAAASIIAAVNAAAARAGEPLELELAQIALAGPPVRVAMPRLEAAFRSVGLTGPVVIAGDLLAMFASVTPAADGYCIASGTGAGAIRVRGGRIDRVADAAGWLLGDTGSGYWLGSEAARAAVAALDGRAEKTALTTAILDDLGIAWSSGRGADSRPAPLRALTDAVYTMRPIELARFAPLVFAHRYDPVAARLIDEAEDQLMTDFLTVFDRGMPGPIALGGGVIPQLTGLGARLLEVVAAAGHTADVRPVVDGSVGAIVLALRALGGSVDESVFETVVTSVAAQQKGAAAGQPDRSETAP